MSRPTRMIIILIGSLAGGYLFLVVLMTLVQRRIVYYPFRLSEDQARAEATALGLLPWESADGRLIGWRSRGRPGANRLVVFHGNAGAAHQRAYWRDGMESVGPGLWEVLLFEYPGYGPRPGSPTEESLLAAAREAVTELEKQSDQPIFLAGISLGSGVATQIAAEFPDFVAGVVLVTPFTTLADAATYQHRWLPVRLMLFDRYDNQAALARYHGRLAVIVAGQDELVPAAQGRKLFANYGGPKRLWEQASATHNSLDFRKTESWWGELSRFLLTAPTD